MEISNKFIDRQIEMLREDGQKFIDRRKEALQNKLELAERKCEENRRRIEQEKKVEIVKRL